MEAQSCRRPPPQKKKGLLFGPLYNRGIFVAQFKYLSQLTRILGTFLTFLGPFGHFWPFLNKEMVLSGTGWGLAASRHLSPSIVCHSTIRQPFFSISFSHRFGPFEVFFFLGGGCVVVILCTFTVFRLF